MQGVGNIVQAFIAFLTLLATVAIALYAYRVSQGQIRPLLSLDIENGKRYTLIQLLNNGLGPANITKVRTYVRGFMAYCQVASSEAWCTKKPWQAPLQQQSVPPVMMRKLRCRWPWRLRTALSWHLCGRPDLLHAAAAAAHS